MMKAPASVRRKPKRSASAPPSTGMNQTTKP